RRQYEVQPDKACVTGDEVNRLWDVAAGQMTRVHPLAYDDPRVLPQLPGKLSMTDIDRVNPPGVPCQQHVGEAAGRSADVKRDPSLDSDCEVVEGMRELDAAARHPRMIASL